MCLYSAHWMYSAGLLPVRRDRLPLATRKVYSGFNTVFLLLLLLAAGVWMDISSHGDAEETEKAKRIIEMEKAMEQEGVKCFVVMANSTDLANFRGARVQAIREETLKQWMVAPVELVRSVLTEDWSDEYAASDH